MARRIDPDRVLDGLNPEQRRAAEAVRGPVCILAGAGSGKTTTITRRIAYQVATETFAPSEILAVTFTDRAATEMRERLKELGVEGVRARTFHATALKQLSHLVPETGRILSSKAATLAPIVRSLHKAYRFRPLAEFANEIEWAKNRRLAPERYLEGLDGHTPPVPADVMLRVYRGYEERKRAAGRIDFEDVLSLLIDSYERNEEAIGRFRSRCRAVTVDEYQDVNLLQQSLLDLWLGDREELCAVGDDYQAIFSFTGATAAYLLALPRRFPATQVIRLEENYRSTPEILTLANRLVPRLGGAEKTLRASCPSGPTPEIHRFDSQDAEIAWIVGQIGARRQDGIRDEEIAALYRVNSRSDDLAGPLAAAGIPCQVRGGSLLTRPATRTVLRLLRRHADAPLAGSVRNVAEEAGLLDELPEGLGDEGVTFQDDLRRLIRLAEELDDGAMKASELEAALAERFGSEGNGRGVQLLTYHRAKGLEFDAVFLPFLQAGELPARQARSEEAVAEERRLLYVGLTRARRHLYLTLSREKRPSPFLAELGDVRPARTRHAATVAASNDDPAFAALRAWRKERAREDGVPAYVVFDNRTLAAIVLRGPRSLPELAEVSGIGPTKLERYGAEVLAVLARL